MIRINLLPVREARRKANLRQQGVLLVGAAVAAIAVAAVMHVSVSAAIGVQQRRVAAAEEELKRVEATVKEVERFRAEKEDIEKKLGVIARLEKSRTGPVRMLDEIATRIPERLWLTELKLSGGVLTLTGFGIDNEVIAAFLTGLEESPFISKVQLEQSELQESKGLKLNQFRIVARDDTVAPPAPEATKAKAKAKGGKRRTRK
jgi:type IV pilus assembly protein PilN